MKKEKISFKYVPVEELIPYARNARIHTDAQVAEIAGSIVEFGFNVPVLIDKDNNLIAGHGRVLAARKLGMEEVPAVIAEHLTNTQRRAFILADNKIHDNSTFDFEVLHLEIEELKGEGFDLSLAGFGDTDFGTDFGQVGGGNFVDPDLGNPPDTGAYKEQYGVIVMCEDETHQQRIFEEFKAAGHNCKVVTT